MGMTVVLELTDEEERRVRARADAQGRPVVEFVRGLIDQAVLAPPESGSRNSTAELFAAWEAEDGTDDPEELRRREAEFEEFKANMNANRALEGRPPVYP
jgi:hypothetical protein